MSVFVETHKKKLRVFVGFVDFKFKFCCEFRSWMFLNHSKWITSCFDGLNIPSYLAYSTLLVITNRDFYGLLNLQKLNYQYLTTSVAVVLVVRWYFNGELVLFCVQCCVCRRRLFSPRCRSELIDYVGCHRPWTKNVCMYVYACACMYACICTYVFVHLYVYLNYTIRNTQFNAGKQWLIVCAVALSCWKYPFINSFLLNTDVSEYNIYDA